MKHLRSVNKDGTVSIESIKSLENPFPTIEDMFVTANRNGYGIIGRYEDISDANKRKAYGLKCGNNQMDIDEL